MRDDYATTSPESAAIYEANQHAPDNDRPDPSLCVGPTNTHDPAVNEWDALVTTRAVEMDRLIYHFTGRTKTCAGITCRTSLDEYPVTCPHGTEFCGDCTWEETCSECGVAA